LDIIMRPVATDQDPLRFPLNQLLGTVADVRLLRVLATEVVGPITASDAAERSGLTEAGARRALARLCKTGFVTRVGGGRSHQFALREADVLAEQLGSLFRSETDRYDCLLGGIRDVLEDLPEVRLSWIDAPPGRLGEPLHIGVVGTSESLSWVGDELRRRLAPLESAFELTIELHRYSRADLPKLDWDDVALLSGVRPTKGEAGDRLPVSHADREQRALRMSHAIRRLLDRDPSLAKRAIRHLERVLEDDQGTAAHDLQEWHSILSQYSQRRLLDFIVSDTPRAQRLRQSSPFFAVLTAEERDEVVRAVEEGGG
jgi:hypothetical protein